MSFTAYWKATTGFNVSDYPVKLGKPVAECSVAELTAHPMCGSISPFANVAYTATRDEILNSNIRYVGGAAGFTYPITSEHSETWAIAGKPSDSIRKQYRRTIFVACPSNLSMPAYFLSENTDARILIVEDIKDPNKLVINFGNTTDYGNNIYRTVNFKISGVQCRHTCNRGQTVYSTAPNQVDYEDPDTHTHTFYNIYPVWIYIYENEAYVVLWEYLCFFGGRYKATDPAESNFNYIQQGNFESFSQTTPKWLAMGYNPNNGDNNTTLHDLLPNGYADPVPTPAQFITIPDYYPYPFTDNLAPDGAGVVYGFTMNNSVTGGVYNCRLDIYLSAGNQWYRANTMCRAGCYFVNNGELLKPIIQNGIVIGYGTPEEESEIDTYRDLNHPVPSGGGGGGGGGGDDDDIDDHSMGAGSGISGICNLWLLTKSQLSDLHSAVNDDAPPGFDPLNSFISVMGLGVAPTYVTSNIETQATIKIKQSDGTAWDTGVSGHIVASQVSSFQFTNIKVNRKYNNFLDFSPYATHEIFLPMCGWLTLPDIAVDRTMIVTYLPDIESLKCRAVVSVVDNSGDRCVIGEKDGIMGAEVPFTNMGHSLFVGDAIVNGASIAGEVITGAIGAGFTKMNAQGGTYRPYEGFTVGMGGTLPGAIANAFVSGNVNRTHYLTGNGTRVGFSDGSRIIIKSIYHMVDKPDNYDHTVGKVCNKTGELSSFSGFTVCENPHINISALEAEKEEIKRLLEQGVIL